MVHVIKAFLAMVNAQVVRPRIGLVPIAINVRQDILGLHAQVDFFHAIRDLNEMLRSA